MPKASGELEVISKTYELVVWTAQHVARFPRGHRFTLGERLEKHLLGILEGLIQAKYTKDRDPLLREANLGLEVLRFHFRLTKDLKCLSLDSYGYAARVENEIGQMVGGWLKKQ